MCTKSGKKNGTVETRPKSGRLPIFNYRKRRELGRVVRERPHASPNKIRNLISTKASESTVRSELKKLDRV